jgi:hypothetical protein
MDWFSKCKKKIVQIENFFLFREGHQKVRGRGIIRFCRVGAGTGGSGNDDWIRSLRWDKRGGFAGASPECLGLLIFIVKPEEKRQYESLIFKTDLILY